MKHRIRLHLFIRYLHQAFLFSVNRMRVSKRCHADWGIMNGKGLLDICPCLKEGGREKENESEREKGRSNMCNPKIRLAENARALQPISFSTTHLYASSNQQRSRPTPCTDHTPKRTRFRVPIWELCKVIQTQSKTHRTWASPYRGGGYLGSCYCLGSLIRLFHWQPFTKNIASFCMHLSWMW